jgi:hypothetical protein
MNPHPTKTGMQTARLVAGACSAMSILAILSCLVYIPVLYTKVNAITNELRTDMHEFKAVDFYAILSSKLHPTAYF